MKSPFPPGSSLVAYLRDSGHETQELSLEQQITELRRWALEHGYSITSLFMDVASGTSTAGRDQFHEMIRYLRSDHREEAGLVVWKWNRFSRNIDEAQFYRADLRRRGVLLYSLNDDIPQGSEGRFLEAAIDWMNQSYIEDLREDTKRGLRNLVENYGCIPGTPPKGFKRERVVISQYRDGEDHVAHRWVPDPDLIPLVKEAWELRAHGVGYNEIRKKTNLYRAKTSFTNFFRNPLFIGRLEYGEDLVIEDYCESIISREVWDAVQKINDKHSKRDSSQKARAARRHGSSFLLSGLAFCACCGSRLNGSVHLSKGNRYHYYRCAREKQRSECNAKPIPKHTLEDAVRKELIEYLQHPEAIAEIQRAQKERRSAEKDEIISKRSALSSDLKSVRAKIEKIIDAITETGHNQQMIDRMNILEEEKANLQQRIKELDIQLEPVPDLTIADIENLSAVLTMAIGNASQKQLKTIYQGVIEKILVERDGKDSILGSITFYLPNSKTPSSEDEGVCAYRPYPGRGSYRRHKPTIQISFQRGY